MAFPEKKRLSSWRTLWRLKVPPPLDQLKLEPG